MREAGAPVCVLHTHIDSHLIVNLANQAKDSNQLVLLQLLKLRITFVRLQREFIVMLGWSS